MTKIAKDSLYNLIGQVVPVAVGVIALPILMRHLGPARVGVLSIAWVIVGYSGLLDLGLSRSLVQIIADLRSRGMHEQVPEVFWTAVIFATPLCLFGSAVFYGCADVLSFRWLNVPKDLESEVSNALRWLSLSVGPSIMTPLLLGYTAGHRRFDLIAYVRITTGVLITGGPAVLALFGFKLPAVMVLLVAARVVALLMCFALAARMDPTIFHRIRFRRARLRGLLSFGLWVTISNVTSPLLAYCDRFVIGFCLSVTAVAYYATPLDAITKTLVVPISLAAALFPAFSELGAVSLGSCRSPTRSALRYVFMGIFPIGCLAALFSPELLRIWLGTEFSERSALVLKVLSLGVIFNGLAQVPSTVLQAVGRPEITARIQLLELLLYVPLLPLVVREFGIVGVAYAWTTRVVADLALLYFHTRKLLSGALLTRSDGFQLAVLLMLSATALWPLQLPVAIGLSVIIATAFVIAFHRELGTQASRMAGRLKRRESIVSAIPPSLS